MKCFQLFVVLIATVLALPAVSQASQQEDAAVVRSCLSSWKTHPFKGEKPEFRTIAARVKVMGIGKDVEDTKPTSKPELVLVKPAVSVMAKSTLRLVNPNGWYCLKGSVAVLGSAEITIHCKAHLASSEDGVAVLGSSEGQGGVAVLGSTSVLREGCETR